MLCRLLLVAALSACGGGASEPTPAAPTTAETRADVTYLANMGVLISAGESKVMIDGLHRFYQDAYAVLPETERQLAEGARGRFTDLDVIIASHRHGDHFSAEAVAAHLAANPRAVFFGPPQAASLARTAARPGDASRVRAIDLPVGSSQHVDVGDIALDFLSLRHTYPERHALVENIGVVVEVAGRRFLHVGDALESADNFAPFELSARDLDVTCAPAWYLQSESGRRLVRDHLSARYILAGHIDPRTARQTVETLGRVFPSAIAMVRSLQTWSL